MGESAAAAVRSGRDLDLLLAWWAGATLQWRTELGDLDPVCVAWQPFNRSHSIGSILLHLADIEGRWIEDCLNGRPRSADELDLLRSHDNRPQNESWTSPPTWAYQQYLDVLDWTRQRSLSVIKRIGDVHYTFEGPNGKTTIQKAIQYLAFHEAYHAGQAVLHKIHWSWGGVEPH